MHPRRRHWYARMTLVVTVATALLANTARAAIGDGARPLQLEVLINGETTGLLASFLLLPDGRIAARRSELVESGLKVPGTGAPDDLVVLGDIVPGHFKYDEPTQTISFDLTDSQRIARAFDAMRNASPRIPVSTDWGTLLNYTLYGSSVSGLKNGATAFNGGSATFEERVFSPYGTFSQTGILGTTTTRDMTALRLDTTFSYSDPGSLITYRAGDSITGALNWTRPIRFGGLQAQRNFSVRQDLVTAPLPSFSGSAAVPSTLDVYLNNAKTYSQEVPSGPFQINNLPLISGGEARLVLRDASGREVETTLPFYTSPQLLREGLTYFAVETGFPRLHYGTDSDSYVGMEFSSFSARHGLFDWLTLEAHAEEAGGLYNGGAGLLARTGDFGVISAAASGSGYQGRGGLQAYAAFETKIWGVTLNASSTRTFWDYNDLASVTAPIYSIAANSGLPPVNGAAPPRAIDRASAGIRLPDLSGLSVSFVHMEPASGSTTNLVSAAWSKSIFGNAQAFVTAFADLSNRHNYGGFAGISFPLGSDSSVSTGVTKSSSGTSFTTDASRPLRSEPGSYAWRVHDNEGAAVDRSASVAYRSASATFQVGVEQAQAYGNAVRSTGQVDGAIAAMGGGVFLTNRIDDAFAVVETGTPRVPVYYENRPIGETNGNGQLLIPNLRSYGNNKISIDPKNLGVNDEIETTENVVAPADRSGVLVKFKTRQNLPDAVVVLNGADGKPLAVGSRGHLDGADDEFVVGYDGRAFVKNLKGANIVAISSDKGECRASFEYTPDPNRQVVIGPVSCL
jgi:outer membrane usher protein